MDAKGKLLHGIDQSFSVCAEIGALDKPVLDPAAAGVRFVDYTDSETLRAKYADDAHVDVSKIVEVSAIWGDNTLLEALGKKVDYIVASHVIEHVPDLVTWLAELHESLHDGGEVRLAVPDRRFTFDYLRQETRLSDVVQAHLVRARVPQAQAVLDFHLNVVRLDCGKAWDEEVDTDALEHFNTMAEAIDTARIAMTGVYRDVHCWVFTPQSFAQLFKRMAADGLINFECANFYDTEYWNFEFFAFLKPSEDRDAMVASWQRMEDAMQFDPRPWKRMAPRGTRSYTSVENPGPMGEIARLEDEIGRMEARSREAEALAAAMLASTSWKVTAPLRAVMSFLRSHLKLFKRDGGPGGVSQHEGRL